MRNGLFALAGLLVVLSVGLTTAQDSAIPESKAQESAVIQPIPKEACSTWCVCVLEELLTLPGGHSWYIAERHEERCTSDMDCSDPSIVFLVLPSNAPPEDCETTGCTYGNSIVSLHRKDRTRIVSVLKSKVPHDYQPEFTPNYSGKVETIHTDFVAFTANDQKRLAKVFIVKVTPSVVDDDHPVRIAALGFEVEAGPKVKPSVTVKNQKNIEEIAFGVHQVNIGGTNYGILIADDGSDKLTANDKATQPTLATK